MLVLLKNKQQKIASVTLSIFIGGWLLLLCQTCLAAIDDNNKPVTEISDSCHSPEIDEPINEINDVHNKHCLGACDYDVLSVTVNSEKSSDLTGKIKFSPDLYTHAIPQITLSNRPPPTYRISTTPEWAILLPFQHYTVLLI